MRDALEILVQHKVYSKDSCIAWAVEFIAKLYDAVPPTQTPIQEKFLGTMGFGNEAIELLDSHKIRAWRETLEWDEFEQKTKEDAQLGFHSVFSIPSAVNLDLFQNNGFGGFTFHGCVALHRDTTPTYATQIHGLDGIGPVALPQFYTFLRGRIKADYRIDVLRHRPK